MNEKLAQFRFVGYKILKSEVNIEEVDEIDNTLTIDFEQSSTVSEEEYLCKHTLSVNIFNEDKSIKIKVVTIGYFEFDSELEEDKKNIFFQTSAPAILFPYVRAYVSALTSLSGINPVILPTLNLSQRK